MNIIKDPNLDVLVTTQVAAGNTVIPAKYLPFCLDNAFKDMSQEDTAGYLVEQKREAKALNDFQNAIANKLTVFIDYENATPAAKNAALAFAAQKKYGNLDLSDTDIVLVDPKNSIQTMFNARQKLEQKQLSVTQTALKL